MTQPDDEYVHTVFLTRDDHDQAIRDVHDRVDQIAESVTHQARKIDEFDKTLGHIVAQQIDDGKQLREIRQFNFMFLQEVQSVRAENLNWHTRWFEALQLVNERLSKGNYALVLLSLSVVALCVVGGIAIWAK